MNEELKVKITAEINDLKKQLNEAQSAVSKFGNASKSMGDKLDKALKKIGEGAKKAASVMGNALKTGGKIGVAGIVAISTAAVKAYSDYEQLAGGVETLFKGSSDKVMAYAENAYKTASVDSNKYMEMATGFSASLISSLKGDTEAAANYTDMMITDMSDNANKMGSNIESLQNAYQGFAKGNFTMLDNLKLGFGGTQAEALRLVNTAAKLDSSIQANDLSLANLSKAIHVIQDDMGITGTTAKEATETISGSLNMAKSAFQNLLTGVANDNADWDKLMNNFTESATIAFGNLLPRIQTALLMIPNLIKGVAPLIINAIPEIVEVVLPGVLQALGTMAMAIVEALPALGESIFANADLAGMLNYLNEQLLANLPLVQENLTNFLTMALEALNTSLPAVVASVVGILTAVLNALIANIPQLITCILTLITATLNAITANLPTILEAVISVLPLIIDSLIEAIPSLLDAAIQFLMAIVNAIPQFLPDLIAALPDIIEKVLMCVVDAIPQLLDGAILLFHAIVDAIPQFLPDLMTMMPRIFMSITSAILKSIPTILSSAFQLFMGIVSAIPKFIPNLINGIGRIISTIKNHLVEKAKGLLKFKWNLPKLKMPHFKATGKFSLNPLQVPKIGIEWYAKGGVFDKPTLFPYGGGVGGLGEAGAEAVVPLEHNTEWLDKIAERLGGGNQQIVLTVDGKVFAETSVNSINQLTRQRGSIPLVIA